MKKVIFLTCILLISFISSYSQKTVLIKVDFFDYCESENNLYLAELKINDTLQFKQYIHEKHFEFNVPKSLLESGKKIAVKAVRFTDNEIEGTICFPFIGSCEARNEVREIPVDSLLDKKEYVIKLANRMKSVGCGSLPKFSFQLNSSNLNMALIDFGPADTLKLLEQNWIMYCLAEIIRRDKKMILEGHADKNEMNSSQLALQRAENIKRYLVEFGVDERALEIKTNVEEKDTYYQGRKLSKQEEKESQMENAYVGLGYK